MSLWSATPPSSTTTTIYGALAIEKKKKKTLHSSFSTPSVSFPYSEPNFRIRNKLNQRTRNGYSISCCSNSTTPNEILSSSPSPSPSPSSVPETAQSAMATMINPPVIKKRKRYRKEYPGESVGITEEMRFVAMRLRNIKGKYINKSGKEPLDSSSDYDDDSEDREDDVSSGSENGDEGTWEPSIEGFLKYLVDSKLVFDTVERIVDQSEDVSYAYFRKTGLERSEGLRNDIEWFSLQNIEIPEPSNPGVSYVKYLEELAEKSPPLFLSHFYNIYFSHIAGGQVISKQVSSKILEGRELEFYRWEGDESESLKGVREKLNMLGEHWPRDARNKCLRETTKSFRYMGQIVRLIIL